MEKSHKAEVKIRGRVWIDLDNSPHVPFFIPIIKELENQGASVFLTGRDAYQVADLVKFYGLQCRIIGRHYGKNKFMKIWGICWRALQLIPAVLRQRPVIAVSHGSRAQMITAFFLRIPTFLLMDYEFASQSLLAIRPDWVCVPDVIANDAVHRDKRRILRYPGIKEDVYVPDFKPDRGLRSQLGLAESDVVVTIRPPADEAHYHNPLSDDLFHVVVRHLAGQAQVKMVILPRNARQADVLRNLWPEWIADNKVIIPKQAMDGLGLIWLSDLVISGGGTMNREAAALGVPVYSIFRGKVGAVDHYLAKQGRLILLESPEDVVSKLVLERRDRGNNFAGGDRRTLRTIMNYLHEIIQRKPANRVMDGA